MLEYLFSVNSPTFSAYRRLLYLAAWRLQYPLFVHIVFVPLHRLVSLLNNMSIHNVPVGELKLQNLVGYAEYTKASIRSSSSLAPKFLGQWSKVIRNLLRCSAGNRYLQPRRVCGSLSESDRFSDATTPQSQLTFSATSPTQPRRELSASEPKYSIAERHPVHLRY